MNGRVPTLVVAMLSLAMLVPAPPGYAAPRAAAVTVIQAVPGAVVSVSVDGKQWGEDARVGDMLGPQDLAPGQHEIVFTGTDVSGDEMTVESTLTVEAGGTTDVVLHLPADVGGEPVVSSYSPPDGPIGPGKARVVLAHTATVAPADVQVNGQTVFTNIANGEYADADVPEGTIEVALLPSGTTEDPILGPLDVNLEARTLSMIYAYGNPQDGSMNVIAHTTPLAADGSVAPSRIDTGSAGLVTGSVATFDAGRADRAPVTLVLAALAALAVVGLGTAATRSRRR